jgi:hypothetical protein
MLNQFSKVLMMLALLVIGGFKAPEASAATHLCFYGPKPFPENPLNPTLYQELSLNLMESVFYLSYTQMNLETQVPDNGIFIGGEVFGGPIALGDTSIKYNVLVFVPTLAVWRLAGTATLFGVLVVGGVVVPITPSDTCFAQGVVTPA